MQTCLIIGINSFTGIYVADIFQKNGYKIVGTVFSNAGNNNLPQAEIHQMNILDYEQVEQTLKTVKADIIIHLAGVSFVNSDNASPFYDMHIMGTRNILTALVKNNISVSKILLASSAQIYGHAAQPCEETAPSPLNDYAVSKLAMEYMAKIYAKKIPLIFVRPFNCIGIGQLPKFLVPKILTAFLKKQTSIELGRTELKRDFLDMRSAAEYYFLLAKEGKAGEAYNISSGTSYSINDIIELFRQISGVDIQVNFNAEFSRAHDPLSITGDNRKIMALTGAKQPIALQDSLTWMYHNYQE